MNEDTLHNELPETVELDITPLRIGMSIRIRDIEIPGVQLLHAPDAVVVSVKTARGAVDDDLDEDEDEEGEEGAEEGEGEEAEEKED